MAHGRPTYRIDGDVLRTHREHGGMTLRGLSKALTQQGTPLGDSQLSKIERGLATPRPPMLKALADLFGVEPEKLLKTQTPAA